MKFSGLMCNFAKFYFQKLHFQKTDYLSIFWLCGHIIYRPDESCHFIFRFGVSLWYLTSGKHFMVIRSAFPEILGGFPPHHPHTNWVYLVLYYYLDHRKCLKTIVILKILRDYPLSMKIGKIAKHHVTYFRYYVSCHSSSPFLKVEGASCWLW